MPWNGSGTFNRVYSWVADKAAGINITASRTDTDTNDITANGLGNCLTRDGQGQATANLPMAGYRHTGAGDAVGTQDYVTLRQVTGASTSLLPPFLRGYISGLTLSNDGSSPNTVLDIAAGFCVDSTNGTLITLGAFTKSTAGAWAAGTGGNGMGSGLTIANATWYHVFAIINAGVADVYFDTSVTAANKPASTAAFRRIGSFLTDGSAHIIAFTQVEKEFLWNAPVVNASNLTGPATAVSKTVTVPPGVNVMARLRISADWQTAAMVLMVTSPLQADTDPATTAPDLWVSISGLGVACDIDRITSTTGAVRVRSDTTGSVYSMATYGWHDFLL